MMERPPLSPADIQRRSIWAVTDGRAGNHRQANALARALSIGPDAQPVNDQCLRTRLPWRAWAPRLGPASAHAFGPAFEDALRHPPTLAIGCGRQGAMATRLLRRRGARVVQILDPRINPSHWDLVIAPQHDRMRGRNVLSTLGSLHPVDAHWLARARIAFAGFGALPQPRTTVLLGASSRHVQLTGADVEQVATHLQRMLATEGGSVLLTTSRRTPAALQALARERFRSVPGIVWTGPDDGDNPYPGLLAWADRIICSADSVNMISEACATTVPVHVFEPQRARGRLRVFLDALLAIERIHPLTAGLPAWDVTALLETERVASEVKLRLGL